MMAWLEDWERHGAAREHKIPYRILSVTRREARQRLAALPNGAKLLAKERPLRPGEEEEPRRIN